MTRLLILLTLLSIAQQGVGSAERGASTSLPPPSSQPPSDAAAILAKVDAYRNPLTSFSIDVDVTSITPDGQHESAKYRVLGRGSDKSIVEFVAPAVSFQ